MEDIGLDLERKLRLVLVLDLVFIMGLWLVPALGKGHCRIGAGCGAYANSYSSSEERAEDGDIWRRLVLEKGRQVWPGLGMGTCMWMLMK